MTYSESKVTYDETTAIYDETTAIDEIVGSKPVLVAAC